MGTDKATGTYTNKHKEERGALLTGEAQFGESVVGEKRVRKRARTLALNIVFCRTKEPENNASNVREVGEGVEEYC
jgi:hypothetical protein